MAHKTPLKLVIGKLKGAKATSGQAVIVHKDPGVTKRAASARVKRAGFMPIGKPRTTSSSYRFRIASPKAFKPRSFRTIALGHKKR